MSEKYTELCDTCPVRGLCVGGVALATNHLVYRESTAFQYPGIELIGTDANGVVTSITKVTPDDYVRTGRKVKKTFPTSPPNAFRSTTVFNALISNPDGSLSAIADRAAICTGPDIQPNSPSYNSAPIRVCRTTDVAVLDVLLSNM